MPGSRAAAIAQEVRRSVVRPHQQPFAGAHSVSPSRSIKVLQKAIDCFEECPLPVIAAIKARSPEKSREWRRRPRDAEGRVWAPPPDACMSVAGTLPASFPRDPV